MRARGSSEFAHQAPALGKGEAAFGGVEEHADGSRGAGGRGDELLVEQYVARALDVADYVYVLQKGRIRLAGEPSELIDDQILAPTSDQDVEPLQQLGVMRVGFEDIEVPSLA